MNEIKIIRNDDLTAEGLLKPDIVVGEITWLVAKGGCYVRKENHLYTATVKVDPPSALGDLKESWALHVAKMPLVMFRQIEAFFCEVYKRYKSEAVIVLYACPEKGWRAECPIQEVSGASVNYKRDQLPTIVKDGEWEYTLFGSIHSHASMGAFHSGTDDKDEMNFDGLHITVGGLDKDEHSYACRVVLHGKPIKVELGDVVEGFRHNVQPPEPWLLRVTERSFATPTSVSPVRESGAWREWINLPSDDVAGDKGKSPLVRVVKNSPPKRVSRKDAEYVKRGESLQCWGCLNFKGHRHCSLVHGEVASEGYCSLFEPRSGFRTSIEMANVNEEWY